jgi:hypothetical protein
MLAKLPMPADPLPHLFAPRSVFISFFRFLLINFAIGWEVVPPFFLASRYSLSTFSKSSFKIRKSPLCF